MSGNDTDRPNIIHFNCHDTGQRLGCYGASSVNTPNLDQLAEEGVSLQNCFCTAPHCSPSRASATTGRYPHNNGVMAHTSPFGWELNDDERHVAELLGEAGWHTALAGFQHETRTPRERFDEFVSKRDECDRIAARAADFIRTRTNSSDPFYLQIGFPEPHRQKQGYPYSGMMIEADEPNVPDYLVNDQHAREEMLGFEGAIHRVDAAFGRITDAIEEADQYSDTLILATTDHGIPFPRAKCTPYDSGIEIFSILRWPGAGIAGGRRYEELISNLDYVPTLLELADVTIPDSVQGRSFAPLLLDEPYSPREEIIGEFTYHTYYDPRRWLRTAEHKLILNFSTAPTIHAPSQSSVDIRPKDPRFQGDHHDPLEVYDLGADPQETENVAIDPGYEEIALDLMERLHVWMRETDDPLLQEPPIPTPRHREVLDALQEDRLPLKPGGIFGH